ncbi:hypothetical protein HYQ45_012938 [Verticillium longisporum]|uniref:Uncharacterized protein n=1 Tax=Verticillium longisporum TaxID=100787 RepID=A0A8I3AJW7_VERLO|nr:hypothetical protein HYQ45_012938 [Verticillium longisporum]
MKFPTPILALLAVAKAAAIPSESEAPTSIFSFEQWVEDIIANPDGKHLSPEEAVDAHLSYINGTDVSVLEARALEKRVTCWTRDTQPPPAWGPDAVTCINYLASIGSRACTVHQYGQLFRRCGNARIYGTTGGSQRLPVTDVCNNVARAAGRVMDSCYRSDNTVRGGEMVSNLAYYVNLNGVN